MSFYLDIAKKVTVGNIQRSSSADHERGCGDELQPDTSTETITPAAPLAVKNHKVGLLEILQNRPPSSKGLGAVEALISPNAPGAQVHPFESVAQMPADGESRADIEFARFEKTAKPMPGVGLRRARARTRHSARASIKRSNK